MRLSIRPVATADLPALQAWLPAHADAALPVAGGADAWLLALSGPQPIASLRVRGPIGLQRPRHWYHVGCVVHAAPELNLFHRQHTLLLGNDHTGASELAEPACAPSLDAAEQASAWRALLDAARQHLQATRGLHGGTVIVELPGLRDAQGLAPFWQGLGRHFHGADPNAVLQRLGPEGRAQLAALMPRQLVYAAFLSPAAQAAIAQAAPAARGWMDTLADAGFCYSHHIDIIDGGPVFETHLDSWLARH